MYPCKIRNVLILDNDPITLHVQHLIVSESYNSERILTAETVQHAISQIIDYFSVPPSSNELDILLIDINLSSGDGFGFLTIIQELNLTNIRSFFLTTSNHERDMKRSKEYPISGFITKPLTVEKVQGILQLSQPVSI
jgi:response regulator of citrate/malate metabolism